MRLLERLIPNNLPSAKIETNRSYQNGGHIGRRKTIFIKKLINSIG